MVDKAIFDDLQAKIDKDTNVREAIRNHVQELERKGKVPSQLSC